MPIAFIAPYEELRSMALELVAEQKYRARVYYGDMEAGVTAARKAIADGAEVLISRGGTAALIRRELGRDVIELRPSVYSAFAYINAHTTPDTRIAISGFNPLVNICRPVCDILRRTYATFELRDAGDAGRTMDSVAAWNPDIVIGDVISTRLAQQRGLDAYIIESSRESLVDAFEQGASILDNLRLHIANERRLSMVLNCTQEGACLLAPDGMVREVNSLGLTLLGRDRIDVIGRPFQSVFPAGECAAAVAAGKNLKNALIDVDGRRFVLDLVCVAPEGRVESAVVLFQLVEQVQQKESSIRAKLMTRGFYARYAFDDIIHDSDSMREAISVAREYARTESNIMILGETGTGKELFAQSIHNTGPRAGGPFVAVNCAALPGSLLESELFGYAPGAFTGALRSGKAGLFEMAHNGTLFLDEVAEMDVLFQARLLRTLQVREVMRIGDSKVVPIDVRIIAATNRDPEEEVKAGRMRRDLYFRLKVLDLRIPPLRERDDDVRLLFRHYLAVFAKKCGRRPRAPSKQVYAAMAAYGWPGNVRELENFAEKYATLGRIPDIDRLRSWRENEPDKKENSGEREPERGGDVTLSSVIQTHVATTLRREKGNISRTAALLGVDRNTIKRWLSRDDGKQ